MSFNTSHVERFVASLNFTPTEGENIKKRAAEAAADYSGDPGEFRGRDLEKVLGSAPLVVTFMDMYERPHSVLKS